MSVHVCETKHCQFTEIRSVESDLPHAYWQRVKRVQCTVHTQRSNFKRKQTQGRIGNNKGVSCYQSYCLQVTKEYCGIKKHSQKLLAAVEKEPGYLMKNMLIKEQQICMFVKVPTYRSCIPTDLNAN